MWYIILLELLIAIIIPITLITLNRFFVQKSEFVRVQDDVLEYDKNIDLTTIDHVKNMSDQYFWEVEFKLVYTPDGEWQRHLATQVSRGLGLKGAKYIPSTNFDSYLKKHNIFCGIRFNTSSYRLPKYLNYSLVFPAHIRSEMPRTDSDYRSSDLFWKTRQRDIGFHQKQRRSSDKDVYYSEGFLSLQNKIFQKFIKMLYDQYFPDLLADIEFEEFPIQIEQMPFPIHADVLSIIKPGLFWVEVIFFVSYMLPTIYLTYVSS